MKFIKKTLNILNKDSNGSIFVLVLMIILILSVLGIALATAANTNYLINNSYIDSNKAYYRAEGIMQQVYAIIEESVAEYGDNFINEISMKVSELEAKETNIIKDEITNIKYHIQVSEPKIVSVTVEHSIKRILKTIKAEFKIADIKNNVKLDWIQGIIAGGSITANGKCEITSKNDVYIGKGYSSNITIKEGTNVINKSEKVDAIFEMLDNHLGANMKPKKLDRRYMFVNTTGQPLVIRVGEDIPNPLNTPGTTGLILSTGSIEFIIPNYAEYENLFKFHNSGAIIAKGDIIFTAENPDQTSDPFGSTQLSNFLRLDFDGEGVGGVIDGWTSNVIDKWRYLEGSDKKLKEIFAIIGKDKHFGNIDILNWREVY